MKRVLVFRYGQLGDTLVALPALWAVRAHFGNAHLTLLSEDPAAGHVPPERILPARGLVDEYWTFATRRNERGLAHVLRLAREIRRRQYDLLLYLAPRAREDARRTRRDYLFFRWLAGLRHVAGFAGAGRVPPRRPGRPLPVVSSETESLLNRLRAADIAVPAAPRFDLALTPDERRAGAEWWNRQGVPSMEGRRRFVAVGPGGKWVSKMWPEDRLVEAGRELVGALRLTPVVFGGADDRAAGGRLVSAWGAGVVAAGELGVRPAAAVMEGMGFYLGNDNGTMHLAAAAGLRCVAIFSAWDYPGRWSPAGAGHVVLRAATVCPPECRRDRCACGNACIRAIPVADVLAACQSLASRQQILNPKS